MKKISAVAVGSFDPHFGFRTIPNNTVCEFEMHADGEIRMIRHEYERFPGFGYKMSSVEFNSYFKVI